MDWNVIVEWIDPKLMVVVAACWCLGYILKQTPRVPDWLIIYIVTGAAVLFTVWAMGVRPESVIQGVLCGAFAVYGHQVVKQTKERD